MKTLSLEQRQTQILKGIAILFVLVGHYYRYANINSSFSFLRSIGYFGAALFAFLSGYGIHTSYKNRGFYKGWLFKRIIKIYIPFLLCNTVSLLVYGSCYGGKPILFRIMGGTDDFVMWYVPFIIAFYLIYFVSIKLGKKFAGTFCLLCIVGVVFIEYGEIVGMASQWYTSVGALLFGIALAEMGIKNSSYTAIAVIGGALVGVIYISQRVSFIFWIKNWSTIMAGILFSYILCQILQLLRENRVVKKIEAILSFLGGISYWIYLTHMKVMLYFFGNSEHCIFTFVASAVVVAYILSIQYSEIAKIIKRIIKTFASGMQSII